MHGSSPMLDSTMTLLFGITRRTSARRNQVLASSPKTTRWDDFADAQRPKQILHLSKQFWRGLQYNRLYLLPLLQQWVSSLTSGSKNSSLRLKAAPRRNSFVEFKDQIKALTIRYAERCAFRCPEGGSQAF